MRNLVLVLGDQLNRDSPAFDDFDSATDLVWMAEVSAESTYVWSSKPRTAVFLAAMRAFRNQLRSEGISVDYLELERESTESTLPEVLVRAIERLAPKRVRWVRPGEWRLSRELLEVVSDQRVPYDELEDTSFYCDSETFQQWAKGRKELRLEHFYRKMRRRHGILMDPEGEPEGGAWNFDKSNRDAFPKDGPGRIPAPPQFNPNRETMAVLELVNQRFREHPGSLDHFFWPIHRSQALEVLDDFVRNRLPWFGQYQDAMWSEEPFLYHSLISSSLNLKLLSPKEVVDAAVSAYASGDATIESVEGFVRQILGWREYVRHIYWARMPGYLDENFLDASESLPSFYWDGDTPLECLRQAVRQTLRYGYAHHIQRLMVTGLYTMLLGVRPREVHEWYLAVYVDAVEWVEAPNTLGMSQFADGGYMSSKPYAASGKYISRMSDYCRGCPMNPNEAVGESACPFTTLYWDFLRRNRDRLSKNARMRMQLKNLDRISGARMELISKRVREIKQDPSCRSLARRPGDRLT